MNQAWKVRGRKHVSKRLEGKSVGGWKVQKESLFVMTKGRKAVLVKLDW